MKKIIIYAFLIVSQSLFASFTDKDSVQNNLTAHLEIIRTDSCKKTDQANVFRNSLANGLSAILCDSTSKISAHTYLETLRVLKKLEDRDCTPTADFDFLQSVIHDWHDGKSGLPLEKPRQMKKLSPEENKMLKQQISGEWVLYATAGTLTLPNFACYQMTSPLIFHSSKQNAIQQNDTTDKDSYKLNLKADNRFSILWTSALSPVRIEVEGDWKLTNDELTIICDTYNYYYPSETQNLKQETAPMSVLVNITNETLTLSPLFNPDQAYGFLYQLLQQCEKDGCNNSGNISYEGLHHYFTNVCGEASSCLSAYRFVQTQKDILSLQHADCNEIKKICEKISGTLQYWRQGFYFDDMERTPAKWSKGSLSLGTIRLLLICGAILGAISLFLGIRGIRKLFFGEIILEMPFNDMSATFTIPTPGKYSIWQRGILFRRTPADKFKPEIVDESSGKKIKLYKSWASVYVNGFKNGRGLLFNFSIHRAGEYRLDILPGSSVLKLAEILYGTVSSSIPLKDMDLKDYYLQVRQSQPLYKTIACIPMIALGAMSLLGGIIMAAMADRFFI